MALPPEAKKLPGADSLARVYNEDAAEEDENVRAYLNPGASIDAFSRVPIHALASTMDVMVLAEETDNEWLRRMVNQYLRLLVSKDDKRNARDSWERVQIAERARRHRLHLVGVRDGDDGPPIE